MMKEYDDDLCNVGSEYRIGFNDGTVLKRMVYIGDKMSCGKPMRCYETREKHMKAFINPSYTSFILEEDMDAINHEIAKQAEHAWEGRM